MIKKTFILFIIFLPSLAFSQNSKWKIYPSLGIDLGGAIPFPLSDLPDGAKGTPKPFPNLGLGTEYMLNEKWFFALEANYHILSFSAKANVRSQPFYFDNKTDVLYFSGRTNADIEIRFIEFPLLGVHRINKLWTFLFGTYYSILLEGSFYTEGTDGVLSSDKNITDNAVLPGVANTQYNFNDNIDVYDFGLLAGYKYSTNQKLLFWAQMHFGFKSIFEKEFENIDYELYQLRLSVGLSYNLFSGTRANKG